MKYLVACRNTEWNEEKHWSIQEYDGDAPAYHFAKKQFYGGDASANPSHYQKGIGSGLKDVLVVPLQDILVGDIDLIRKLHCQHHEKEEALETSKKDHQEFMRLKKKLKL